jgi:phospholipid/cholesterol/gamma-HCH transport system substrate-binding protein
VTRFSRRGPIFKLGLFLALSGAVATYLAIVLGNISFADTHDYHAIFTDVSGLKSGSPVRIAGVDVGEVDGVSIYHGDQVKVDFDVDRSIALGAATTATVRYKNLIGDRYLELSDGSDTLHTLASGATIPASRTSPALDLDTLLNGFKPLFTGLDPTQINAVSNEIIQVFQGESGTVTSLLSTVASLTSTLANRDQLIGSVITNLNGALSAISDHGADLDILISQVQQLVSGLAADRNPIGDAIVHINDLATSTAGLLTTVRPDLKDDVAQLGKLATTLDAGSDTLTYVLNRLPKAYQVLARLGAYGNFFNFYLCSTNFRITLPNGKVYETPPNYNKAARCK